MRRRFFVNRLMGDRAYMTDEAAHHLARVLRAQKGQIYELSDGVRVRLARIESVARDRVEFVLLDEVPAHHPSVETTLLLSIVKFEAFEWALEKATELGVSRIAPLAASRSEKALVAAAAKRAERWKTILLEASQQSRRVNIPVLEPASSPAEQFRRQTDGLRTLLSEQAEAPSLKTVLSATHHARAVLAIGPEGGWTDAEIEGARGAGFCEASLGKLILRTETAVVVALAIMNYALASESQVTGHSADGQNRPA
jgi:16S rRNA (uracil1498-N3)-methyltransferase